MSVKLAKSMVAYERIIVGRAMPIFGVDSYIVQHNLDFAGFLSPLEDAFSQRAVKHAGKQSQDIKTHTSLGSESWKVERLEGCIA